MYMQFFDQLHDFGWTINFGLTYIYESPLLIFLLLVEP